MGSDPIFQMKYSIVTFGCRVNQADSLAIEERLRQRGSRSSASPEDADLVVVNTCSVTASADQGASQTIRRIVRSNPGRQGRGDRLLCDTPARRCPRAAKRRARCAQRRKGFDSSARSMLTES